MSGSNAPSIENPGFSVVTDTANLLVINKSPGIGFHDEQGEPGICSRVQQALGYSVFPVHRLDKDTSGLMLLPKSSTIARELTEQFSNHQVQKYYLAFSAAKPAKKQGWVIGDMAKSRNGSWKLTRQKLNPAISYFISRSFEPGIRGYLLRLYSGKTHQARVALKSVGAPLIGDTRYGGEKNADRLYLHAFGLKFSLQNQVWQLMLPPDQGTYFTRDGIEAFLSPWQSPWELSWPELPGQPKTPSGA